MDFWKASTDLKTGSLGDGLPQKECYNWKDTISVAACLPLGLDLSWQSHWWWPGLTSSPRHFFLSLWFCLPVSQPSPAFPRVLSTFLPHVKFSWSFLRAGFFLFLLKEKMTKGRLRFTFCFLFFTHCFSIALHSFMHVPPSPPSPSLRCPPTIRFQGLLWLFPGNTNEISFLLS